MKGLKKRALSLLLALGVQLALLATAASATAALPDALHTAAAHMLDTVTQPQVGSVGGEWAVIGLARSGVAVPQSYWDEYYAGVEDYVEACGGILHEKKYTEYSRLIIALTAIGADPTDVAGYNLLTALGDYERTIWQGLNGPTWALIALDCGGYEIPENPEAKTQATRQMYVDRILACQLPDGGWSLYGGTELEAAGYDTADPDITGMALQALARYQDQSAVAKATEEALSCMSGRQNSDGGFESEGVPSAASTAQILVALCELGISLDDWRFVKTATRYWTISCSFAMVKVDSFTRRRAPAPARWPQSRGCTPWRPPGERRAGRAAFTGWTTWPSGYPAKGRRAPACLERTRRCACPPSPPREPPLRTSPPMKIGRPSRPWRKEGSLPAWAADFSARTRP